MTALHGTHHVSALSAEIGKSRDFYVRVLGLRPVITTVNQDDPSMYHLFFGDGAGTPGSDMTVFDLPHSVRERRGNNSISLTTFRVTGDVALQYWLERFGQLGVLHTGSTTRDGRAVIDFEDPLGTRLSLIDDDGLGAGVAWNDSPVPSEHQIRGLGYTVLTVPHVDATAEFLENALGLRFDHACDDVHVYRMHGEGVHTEMHVQVAPGLQRARYGSGGVHHVALRVPAMEDIGGWAERLSDLGYANRGVVDRYYFQSVYVREPNHILIELATDGPGFEVDGPLGDSKLSLPPFLEPRRAEIIRKLGAPLELE